MGYIVYNQLDYGDVPYPSKSLPKATVKSGGCGVVCMMILLANMAAVELSAKAAAAYAIKKGARVEGGTDMFAVCKALEKDYGFDWSVTNDVNEMLRHVADNGFAVANVSGDRAGYTGVYSNGGHYVVVAGATEDRLVVLDPAHYVGKFTKAGRAGKVQDIGGGVTSCAATVLNEDTKTRNPAYYLFSREGFTMEKFPDTKGHWAEASIKKAVEKGVLKGKGDGLFSPDEPLTRAELATVLDRLGLLDK